MFSLLLLISLLLLHPASCVVYNGEISIPNPNLLNIFTHSSISNALTRFSVLASTLDTRINQPDPAFVFLQPGPYASNNFTGFQPNVLYNVFYWPKEIAQIPNSVFGQDSIVTADGSTIIGKTKGAVYVTDVRNFNFPGTSDISSPFIPQDSWIYGRILFKRIANLNLRYDILTCRYKWESGSLSAGQLVWLVHPLLNEMTSTWDIEILKEDACDTNLAQMDISYPGLFNNWDVVYATGLHTRQLTYFWAEQGSGSGNSGDWHNPNHVQFAVLASGREFYDLEIFDLNRDGRQDVLVTVVANDQGSVEVFVPASDNFRDPSRYNQHIIASGFTSRNGGANGRSPGVVKVFYPTANRNVKPWIIVAGGDDGRAYYLRPNSEHVGDWIYQMETIIDEGPNQIISGVAVVDIDGDGYTEVFLSVRNRGVVKIFSFKDLQL